MRKILIGAVLVGALWSAWWWAASATLHGGISAWFDARSAEGWQAERSALTGGGFPLTLQATLSDIAVADPQAGVAIQTDRLTITAPAFRPADVTLTLDEGPILLASPLGRSTLTMQEGRMALSLRPGTQLELQNLGWTSGPWRLQDETGTQVQADSLWLSMTRTNGATYDYTARAQAFAPGDATRASLRLPDTVPRAFQTLSLQATVTFERPWDRRALNSARPQPRQINLHLAQAQWGDLNLNFAADLTVDNTGTPEGSVSIQAENWRAMLDLAQASGTMSEAMRRQAEGVLQLLAGASGNTDTLDVNLSLRGGTVFLGFLPLGPAPRLILR